MALFLDVQRVAMLEGRRGSGAQTRAPCFSNLVTQ
jgi:hypothetical protein